jgi:hypothetical protein
LVNARWRDTRFSLSKKSQNTAKGIRREAAKVGLAAQIEHHDSFFVPVIGADSLFLEKFHYHLSKQSA